MQNAAALGPAAVVLVALACGAWRLRVGLIDLRFCRCRRLSLPAPPVLVFKDLPLDDDAATLDGLELKTEPASTVHIQE